MVETLTVILLFGGVLFGLGWGMAVALRLPYVGIGAAVAFAVWLIVTGSYAMPFGWSRLVGDIGLVAVALLIGGAWWLRRGQSRPVRAYAPLDIGLLVAIGVAYSVPALVLPVPLDTDAQGFGYLALMARMGGSLSNLAPFNPDLDYLYAPALSMVSAYLSEWLTVPMHRVQFGIGAVLSLGVLVVLYDWGHAIAGQARARAHVLAALIGTGLLTAYMDSHYTSVMGLMIGGAFLAFIYHLLTSDEDTALNVILAGILLAGLVLAHPDTTIIIGLGFGAWLLLAPFSEPRPTRKRWLLATFAVPAVALVGVASWLMSVLHLLGGDITSPFSRYPNYWRVVLGVPPEILYHGGVVTLLALVGVGLTVRNRPHVLGLGVGWILLILDFSTFGIIEHTLPLLAAPIVRYDYPFSLAWHGPIIPYALLGGVTLHALGEWLLRRRLPLRGLGWALTAIILSGALVGGVFHRDVLAFSKGRVTFFGAFASAADVQAMDWLRENTESDAYILNFPGPQEGDWIPVIAERPSVYYRPQPFFTRDGDPLADTPEQDAMRAFWLNPADADNAALLQDAGVDYVIVPQVVVNPDSFATHVRWRRPFTDLITDEMQSAVSEADYLTLVFDADGAQVYQVEMP